VNVGMLFVMQTSAGLNVRTMGTDLWSVWPKLVTKEFWTSCQHDARTCAEKGNELLSFGPECPAANRIFLVSVVSASDRLLVLLEMGFRELSEISLTFYLNRQSTIQTKHKCKEQ